MTEFARWWQRREEFVWSARMSDAQLEIRAKERATDLAVIVEQEDRYAVLPAAAGTYPLSELEWHALPEPVRFDPASLSARKPGLLHHVRSLQRTARKNLQGHRG